MERVDDIFLWSVAVTLPLSVAAYHALRSFLRRAGRDVQLRSVRFKMMALPLAIGVVPVWVVPRLTFGARLGITVAAFLIPYFKFVMAEHLRSRLKPLFHFHVGRGGGGGRPGLADGEGGQE